MNKIVYIEDYLGKKESLVEEDVSWFQDALEETKREIEEEYTLTLIVDNKGEK